MRAKLKSWYSTDIQDLPHYVPTELTHFCFDFRAIVGPDDGEGEESFDMQICTPQWLLANMKEEDILCGRHYLIVREYNFKRILNKIKQLIESCSGNNWDEVAAKVSRIAYWEFEDYQEQP